MSGRAKAGPLGSLINEGWLLSGMMVGTGATAPTPTLGKGWSVTRVSAGIYRVQVTKAQGAQPYAALIHADCNAYLNSDSNYTCYVRNLVAANFTFDIEFRVAGVLTDLTSSDLASFFAVVTDSSTGKTYGP